MRHKGLIRILLVALLVSSAGCASVISAVRENPISSDPSKRTLGSVVDDQLIETKGMVNIREAGGALETANISLTSYNGVVLMTGEAPDAQSRAQAEAIVKTLEKVKKIHNEVRIAGSASAISSLNDTWLTTKTKANLLLAEGIPGNRFKVVTDNSTLYLMGLVTRAEADAAVAKASTLSGIEKIVKVFEYLD
ncbi:MAG: BON domain-containing protein [Pontibacterium sp.]